MTFKVIPIDMISAPNYWAPLAEKMWTITSPNAQVLWFSLCVDDALGLRPYSPAAGATIVATFQRSDLISVGTRGTLVNTVQNVTKNGTFNAQARNICSLSLTPLDAAAVASGSIKLDFTESGVTTTWLQNWAIKKLLTDPGY